MSTQTTVDLFFIGKDADSAVRHGVAYHHEKNAQEDVWEGDKIFHIPVTVFSSRVKEVSLWE